MAGGIAVDFFDIPGLKQFSRQKILEPFFGNKDRFLTQFLFKLLRRMHQLIQSHGRELGPKILTCGLHVAPIENMGDDGFKCQRIGGILIQQ